MNSIVTVKRAGFAALVACGTIISYSPSPAASAYAVGAAARLSEVTCDRASQMHHGKPSERAATVVRSFEVAYRQQCVIAEVIRLGLDYVAHLWRHLLHLAMRRQREALVMSSV